ncbi:c-type cytochrome [Sphaerotilus sp.]|uniref:c-type cytochrome n=1 Tax=Sphaerotilus sp. TaxID=2093942 RepID=UPI002ACD4192|nr:c-type cytochrome [Sphaerotilus sp.]MDZ7855055.1 c-type cytochrome [Sphaerotilus sp.]
MKRITLILAIWAAALAPAWAIDAATHAAAAKPTTPTAAELRQRLAAMPPGDVARGEKLYAQQFCASCHGADGRAPTLNWPSIAGQRVEYGYKLLQDYRQGLRHEGERAAVMRDAVRDLSDRDLADLATYTAQLRATAQPVAVVAASPVGRTATVDKTGSTTPAPAVPVDTLVRHGDPGRLLTACASCHGARGEGGTRAQPALAGQNPAYLVRTLLDYQSGLRANDPARGMRHFAAKLSRTEIEALAAYYASLPALSRAPAAATAANR